MRKQVRICRRPAFSALNLIIEIKGYCGEDAKEKATVRETLTGRIAIKVVNHLGNEVMKVFRVE